MKHREVVKALRSHGLRSEPGKGSHVKWYCPCGRHMVSIPGHTTVSPGVIRDCIKKLTCLPEGWLQ
ncbi:MAG: type II toxin-antitoxin system HicA family toxin [Geodermatophilaceae bacterium]|nr:type II toxin-antitoxin system HicA family toxin [Geodermatophilaceae bacterium]